MCDLQKRDLGFSKKQQFRLGVIWCALFKINVGFFFFKGDYRFKECALVHWDVCVSFLPVCAAQASKLVTCLNHLGGCAVTDAQRATFQ